MIAVSTGEFLDQPLGGLLYPPPWNAELQTTSHPLLNTAYLINGGGCADRTVFRNDESNYPIPIININLL